MTRLREELNELKQKNNNSRHSRRGGTSGFDRGQGEDAGHNSYSQGSKYDKDSKYSEGRGSARRESQKKGDDYD